jgi:hypothetical protein
MSLLNTLEYFIDDVEQHLGCLECEIREETNYDDEGHQERMNDFCEQYDEHKARLEDLKQIKQIIQNYEHCT